MLAPVHSQARTWVRAGPAGIPYRGGLNGEWTGRVGRQLAGTRHLSDSSVAMFMQEEEFPSFFLSM